MYEPTSTLKQNVIVPSFPFCYQHSHQLKHGWSITNRKCSEYTREIVKNSPQ